MRPASGTEVCKSEVHVLVNVSIQIIKFFVQTLTAMAQPVKSHLTTVFSVELACDGKSWHFEPYCIDCRASYINGKTFVLNIWVDVASV